MFTKELIEAVVKAAKLNGIRPAALLALIEVETAGKAFEADGKTPAFLYERHVAYREAAKCGLLKNFVNAGLAIPHWSRATQYSDERTSEERLKLIARARSISREVANRSASWGLGQTMGFNFAELGFRSANELVDFCGTADGQVECLIRELKAAKLIGPLNAGQHGAVAVARGYNGPGYAENHYDTRLAAAEMRWERVALPDPAPAAPAPQSASAPAASPAQAAPPHPILAFVARLFGRPVAA